MAEDTEETGETPKKKSKLPLILGLVVAMIGGGGSFFAIYSGLLFGGDHVADPHEEAAAEHDQAMADIDFVPIEPMTISLGPAVENRHLRFRAQLEVPKAKQANVNLLIPRVVDVLNSYLRALDIADLEDPAALTRLRAQMLRRVQVVTGPGQVNDLLVMEFVMN